MNLFFTLFISIASATIITFCLDMVSQFFNHEA
jgi:hypothetical protein